jgi:transposase-like protein
VATGQPEANGVPPLADDRPYVDGSAVSAEELRAEVDRLSNEERQHVDDLREEVGDSVAALASRLDVKARVAERKDEAVATVHQKVDQARTVAVDRAAAAKDTAAQKPGLVAGVAAALLVLLVVVLRRRRG